MKTSTGLAVLSVLASYAAAAPADALEKRGLFDSLKGAATDDSYKAVSQTNEQAFKQATNSEILCVKWRFPTKNGAPEGMTDDDEVADAGGMHTDLVCGNVEHEHTVSSFPSLLPLLTGRLC